MHFYTWQLYAVGNSYTAVFEFPEVPAFADINLSRVGIGSIGGTVTGYIAHYNYMDQHNIQQTKWLHEKPMDSIYDYVSLAAHPRMTGVTFELDSNYDTSGTANAIVYAMPGGNVGEFPY